jgi:hypothetical protein
MFSKKIIIKTILLALPIFLVIAFFEYNLYKMPTSYNFKKTLIEKNAPTTEILILGSSYSLLGINPDFLNSNALNMADNGQSLYYDWKILEKYIGDMDRLKVVIIPVSYLSFEYGVDNNPEYWRDFFYERYYNIPPENTSHLLDIKRFSFLALYGQRKALIYATKNFKTNLAETFTDKGYDFVEAIQDNQLTEENGKSEAQHYTSLMNPNNAPENIIYLEKIIEKIKDKGALPILITIPTFHTIYDNADQQKYISMQNNIRIVSEKYNILYLNYSKDKRFSSDDFYDSSHLNQKGAEKFTKILNINIAQ